MHVQIYSQCKLSLHSFENVSTYKAVLSCTKYNKNNFSNGIKEETLFFTNKQIVSKIRNIEYRNIP